MSKEVSKLVKELAEMKSSPSVSLARQYEHQTVIETAIEYIEERQHYGDPVDIAEYEGIVDFVRYLVNK